MTVDECCFRASLATLLQDEAGMDAPARVLGRRLRTDAQSHADGIRFDSALPGLLNDMRAEGHVVGDAPLRGDVSVLAHRLASGKPAVVTLDTFALPHYWIDRGRVHSLHAVLLHQPTASSERLILRDMMDVTHTRYETSVSALEPAVTVKDIGQSVMQLGEGAAAAPPPEEPPGLSPIALVDALSQWNRDTAVPTRISRAQDDSVGAAQRRVLRGLWNVIHACRWHAEYLRIVGQPGEAIARAGHALLAARGLLMRRSAAASDLADRYALEIERRLHAARCEFEVSAATRPIGEL